MPAWSASHATVGSCSSSAPWSREKRFRMRPAGVAWKKASGARRRRAAAAAWRDETPRSAAAKKPSERASDIARIAAVRAPYVATHFESSCSAGVAEAQSESLRLCTGEDS